MVALGIDPPPIRALVFKTSLFIPIFSSIIFNLLALSKTIEISSVILLRVGFFLIEFSSSIYCLKVYSRAAIVNLSTLIALRSGFFLSLVINSFLPIIIPHCGPPKSLSPLKVIRSIPELIESKIVFLQCSYSVIFFPIVGNMSLNNTL